MGSDRVGVRHDRRVGGRALRSVGSLLVLTCASQGPASAQTILNVERLQPGDVEGTHWGVERAFSLSRGNSEIFDVLAGVVHGHRWEEQWLRAFVGLDYRSETGEPDESDQCLHVRYNRWWTGRWQSFHFVQYQGRASCESTKTWTRSGLFR